MTKQELARELAQTALQGFFGSGKDSFKGMDSKQQKAATQHVLSLLEKKLEKIDLLIWELRMGEQS